MEPLRAGAFLALLIVLSALFGCTGQEKKSDAYEMVIRHARAWEDGDREELAALLHEDAVFAYPGRRLNKSQALEDLDYFAGHFNDTHVYINKIIIDGEDVAVEWQFATTEIGTGERQVVSDAIIAKVKDGRFILWKEYLDGRVKMLQASGELRYEEGQEPFPWPEKTESYGKVS